jgi:hypothetical protein
MWAAIAMIGAIGMASSVLAQRPAPVGPQLVEDAGWARVRALAPGTPVVVSAAPGGGRVRVVDADDGRLVVLDVSSPVLDTRIADRLVAIARTEPATLVAVLDGQALDVEGIRIAPDVITRGTQRLTFTDVVLRRIARADVSEVRIDNTRRRTLIGGLLASAAAASMIGDAAGRERESGPGMGVFVGWGLAGASAVAWNIKGEVVYRRRR